ncbi:hypothetical protein LCGC14_2329930, partial [marine sediment metagenome]
LKTDIQERLEIDHFHAGDAQDGEHKKLTLGAPIATPANVANKGFLYGKDVGGKIELHWEDEDGNEIALTAAGSINAFPATTSMLFYQSAAPAGWTKDVATFDDHGIRVVSSTAWSAGSKGTDAFSTVFSPTKPSESHILTTAELPTTLVGQPVNAGTTDVTIVSAGDNCKQFALGSGSGHTHDVTMDLNYINMIRATKD